MTLLGDRNWYLPCWLEWIPHLRSGRAYDGGVEHRGVNLKGDPMNALSLKTLLLVLAILLFLVGAMDDSRVTWIPLGLRSSLPLSSSRRPAGAATWADLAAKND